MPNDNQLLPDGFADLEPLLARWARPTENERSAIRLAATPQDFAEFHEVVQPRLAALLDLLSGCPPHPADPACYNALMLASAFAEAAPHHELYGGSAEVPHSFDARRFVPEHGAAAL